MKKIYKNIIKLLAKHDISYKEFEHNPILNYEDVEKEKSKFKWTGVESKNVFLKSKKGNYYIYLTIPGCIAPFGFEVNIPTKTIQIRTIDLKKVLDDLRRRPEQKYFWRLC